MKKGSHSALSSSRKPERTARVAIAILAIGIVIVSALPVGVQAAAGNLDPSFGAGGKITTDFFGDRDRANAMALQSDGKIVVAGSALNMGMGDFALARYNPDGSLDMSFGVAGKVTTDFFGFFDEARAVAIQSDGKIVAAGVTFSNDTFTDLALARYNSDGSLDTSFGTAGKVTLGFPMTNERANAVALQGNGKILVAGVLFTNTLSANFLIARYNSDGSLDTTFGTAGQVSTDFLHNADEANALVLQSDGKIVAAGYARDISLGPQFALARYKGDGSLDTTFGMAGKVVTYYLITRVAYDYEIKSVALQSDGKIVAAGFLTSPSFGPFFALARYNIDGSLDATFGSGGRIPADIIGNFSGVANAVAIQSDGKIVAAGFKGSFDQNFDFELARYNHDGSLDMDFGTGGVVTTDFSGGFDEANAVAIQSDGKIVAAGFAENTSTGLDFALARYNPLSFDLCLQDDSSGNTLQINSSTGEYLFTSCGPGGLSIGGRGRLIIRGSLLTLQDYAADRRVMAKFDGARKQGTASIQLFSSARTFTIIDKNTADNLCHCR
jgi:hypothetical protein